MKKNFDTKSEARAHFTAIRSSLSLETRKEKSNLICKKILELLENSSCDTLFLYAPIKTEVDIFPLLFEALQKEIKVAFPISVKSSSTLDFRIVDSPNELILGSYQIPEPRSDLPKASFTGKSICVVPALSFDKKGNRLGYGKGFYDRFLSEFNGISIGVTFNELKCDELPIEDTDVPVDIIITDKESVKIK